MNYKEKVIEILEKNMSENGFKLWLGIEEIMIDVWNHPTSSTGKYHKKHNGTVPNIAEHVYEMLYAAVKIYKLFNIKSKSTDADKILLAIAMHDSLKYGNLGTRKHTDSTHDKLAADMISSNKKTFKKLLTEEQFYTLEETVRFHSGMWSTDIQQGQKFNWNKSELKFETFFIHCLDMLSTADCLITDVRE